MEYMDKGDLALMVGLLRGVKPYRECTHEPVADVDDNGVVSVVCVECPFAMYMPMSEWMKIEAERV